MADSQVRLDTRVPRVFGRPLPLMNLQGTMARGLDAFFRGRPRSPGFRREVRSTEIAPLLEGLEAGSGDGSAFLATFTQATGASGQALRWGLLISLLLHGCLAALLLTLPMHPSAPVEPPFLVVTLGPGGPGGPAGEADTPAGGGDGGPGEANAVAAQTCSVAAAPEPDVPPAATPPEPIVEPPPPPEVAETPARVELEPTVKPEPVMPVIEKPKPEPPKPVKKAVKTRVPPPEKKTATTCAAPAAPVSAPPPPAVTAGEAVSPGNGTGSGIGTAGEGPATGGGTGTAVASVRPGTGIGGGGGGTLDAAFGTANGPRFLRRVMPRYPKLARQFGREGTSLLSLSIDERGRLLHVEVLEKAGSGFDEEAVRAVRESTFSPAVQNGRPVSCRARLPVQFVLRSGKDN